MVFCTALMYEASDMKNELTRVIRFRMDARGYTSRDLSNKSGIPYSTICKFLSSGSEIGSNKLISLLNALDLDLINLITYGDNGFLAKLPPNVQKHILNIAEGA